MTYIDKLILWHIFFRLFTLSAIIHAANSLFLKKEFNKKGLEIYECGFQRQQFNRKPINVKFFRLCLRFLLFDLEILRLLPALRAIEYLSLAGITILTLFFVIINIGFFIEFHVEAFKT